MADSRMLGRVNEGIKPRLVKDPSNIYDLNILEFNEVPKGAIRLRFHITWDSFWTV